jgi:hypothetical protein
MQQPPNPYNAPTSQYTPSPYNYNMPPKRPAGFRHWFRTRSRKTKFGIGCGTLIAALLLCICAATAYGSSTVATTLTPTPNTSNAAVLSTPTPTPTDTSTATPTEPPTHTPTQPPTPTPTPKPVVVPTQAPQPTQPPKPTQPACHGVNNNPWCYDFNPGKLIYIPPSGFCNYFNCIASFYEPDDPGDGYIVECSDGAYSQSGGERGACSYHSGVMRPLYSH